MLFASRPHPGAVPLRHVVTCIAVITGLSAVLAGSFFAVTGRAQAAGSPPYHATVEVLSPAGVSGSFVQSASASATHATPPFVAKGAQHPHAGQALRAAQTVRGPVAADSSLDDQLSIRARC
jgi:hypothetical protein